MASALSGVLTAYRTALAASPASLVNLPEAMDIDDLPVSTLHKTFVLRVSGTPQVRQLHGGGQLEYDAEIELEIHWDPELDLEAIHNTIADDLINATHVMVTQSNRPAGCIRVWPIGIGRVEKISTNDIAATMQYEVRCRETKDTA